jgi:endonuclease/exonuclease/phosphatase family metal-dependent hydrolase
VDQFEFLASATGMRAIAGPTLESGRNRYGNALLTRLELRSVAQIDLSVPGREPRGAIEAVAASVAGPLRVLATHLGLRPRERRAQARKLASHLGDGMGETPVVVLGDLNSVSGSSLAPLRTRMGRLPRRRTYPARRPLLPLDRVWVRPPGLLADLRAHRSPLARAASDHLPLRAELRFDA